MSENREPPETEKSKVGFKERLWEIIFLHDTPGSRRFDIVLLVLITVSVLVIMLESVDQYGQQYKKELWMIELAFTALFTVEYLIRIWVVRKKHRYIFSFFGFVDLLSILPTYLAFIFTGSKYLVVIRILRLLRMFRILKMARHVSDSNVLMNALHASRSKLTVFIFSVLALTAILGTVMYVVEGVIYDNPSFSNIPESIYWGVVTISTTGYGDVTPKSPPGKLITTIIMLLGYAIIAVPTGIVSAELNTQMAKIRMDTRVCESCGSEGHDPKASHCKMCGGKL